MKNTIKLEELGMFLLSIYLFSLLHFAWWWYLVLILAPDISMVGYAINNQAGALLYNIFHHKGFAIVIYLLGIYLHNEIMQLIGIILFGHSSLDRLMGYGLKYKEGFQFTHLGKLERKSK